jgi:hypothetical protein
MAEALLSGDFKSGQRILVTRKDEAEHLFFKTEPLPGRDEGGSDDGDDGGPTKPTSPSKTPAKTA